MTSLTAQLDRTLREGPPGGTVPLEYNPNALVGRQRQDSLYAILCDLAAAGSPLPTNHRIREMLGLPPKGEGTLHRAIDALKARDMIRMEYGASHHYRRVVICATGAATEWACSLMPKKTRPTKVARAPRAEKPIKVAKPPRPRAEKKPKPIVARISPATKARPLLSSRGYSDSFLYGHLADAVRYCRRRGDVIYRDPRNKTVILINGEPRDVLERRQWHERRSA